MLKFLGFPRPLAFPEPPVYKPGTGGEYARLLAEKGQRQSFRLIVIGWIFIITAGTFALLGTTARTEFQVDEEQQVSESRKTLTLRSGPTNWFSAHIGMVFGGCAIVFAGIGWQSLDRATAAALLASAATTALSKLAGSNDARNDLRAYKMCVEAKIGWLEGRMNHDRISTIAQSFFGDGRDQPAGRRTENGGGKPGDKPDQPDADEGKEP